MKRTQPMQHNQQEAFSFLSLCVRPGDSVQGIIAGAGM